MRFCPRNPRENLQTLIYIDHVYSIHHPLYIKDNHPRVKVRKVLDLLSQKSHKPLIIKVLGVDKMWTRRGFLLDHLVHQLLERCFSYLLKAFDGLTTILWNLYSTSEKSVMRCLSCLLRIGFIRDSSLEPEAVTHDTLFNLLPITHHSLHCLQMSGDGS